MLVSQILKTKGDAVYTVKPSETVAEVAAMLTSRRVGALVVLDHEKVVGIVSERDVVRALADTHPKFPERRAPLTVVAS